MIALCLFSLLFVLFWEAFRPGHTVASNDGPLGALCARCSRLPETFFGCWVDLNWLGLPGVSTPPGLTQALALVSGKVMFSKLYAPFALLFLGLSSWICFRQWKLSPLACFLGALAVALNSGYFSTACWGVASQPIAFGFDFLALAALADLNTPRRWWRVILAGLAVGMAVMEAFDIGAIFSLLVAVFVAYQAVAEGGTWPARIKRGFLRLSLVTVFAGFIAAGTVTTLIETQIKGVAGMEQDPASKARRWDQATQYSSPKMETLSLFVPGLFGYRMDTPQDLSWFPEAFVGGKYWGGMGRDASWDRYFASGKQGSPPRALIRHSGGGSYAGVLVVTVALWTLLQSLRKEHSVFPLPHRRSIWFWGGVALFSLLMAFGRHAPFYQLLYALPYASVIRNPGKFIHLIEWALLILFAYGLNGLSQRYLEGPGAPAKSLSAQLRAWWVKAATFDRRWVMGSALAVGLSLLAGLGYSLSRTQLVAHLQEVNFQAGEAEQIASFSIGQIKWFLLFLVSALSVLTLTISGYFGGGRAKLGAALLGLVLVLDLARANFPWIVIWDYERKYSSNPIVDFLREKPYEHRVALARTDLQSTLFGQLHYFEWMQHIWLSNNIQTLDVFMLPRPPLDYVAFEDAFRYTGPGTIHRIARHWQLTNTRYLLDATEAVEPLNQQLDPEQRRFHLVSTFELVLKPGIERFSKLDDLTGVPKADGQFALIEFTGALPRTKLYSNWLVQTNDNATLQLLAHPAFDPATRVLVAEDIPLAGAAHTNVEPGTVEIQEYAPRHLSLQAKANVPSILLLNDHFDPNWKARVDGHSTRLLRCNYVMRGVQVPAGVHRVEFEYAPSTRPFFVSLAALAFGLGLAGFLAIQTLKSQGPASGGKKALWRHPHSAI